jgi:predicted transcriptional regulator
METRTITLDADVVARIERIAAHHGRTPDEVLEEILAPHDVESSTENWASMLAQQMETTDIDWKDEPDLSVKGREHFQADRRQHWETTQDQATNDNA